MSNIAVFDLDYTLTKRGTWGRFVWQNVKTRPWLWLPLLVTLGLDQLRYKMGSVPRIRVKQNMMKWAMVGKTQHELVTMGEAFALKEISNGLRPGAKEVLERHKMDGDTLIIASAGACIIVKPIARLLGIEHSLATNMKWQDGYLAPEFDTLNCYGEVKLKRFQEYLQEQPSLKQTDTIITFYSDSYSDIELLSFCDKGVAVNPDKRLRAAAPAHGWEVVDWGT